MEELRGLSDTEAATQPARPRNPHAHDHELWEKKVRRMIQPHTGGQSDISGPLQIFWNLLLKELPLPDGKALELVQWQP